MSEQKLPVPRSFFQAGLALHLGFSVAAPLVFFITGGIWLDKKFGKMPLFTILGIFVALVVSGFEIARIIKGAQRK